MKRKVIKLGQATYVASLPSKWIREHNLEKGDYLECEIEEGNLIFSTDKRPTKDSELFINISDYNKRTITISLHQIYRKGFDKLTIQYKNKEQFEIIQKVVKNTLLGFEIVQVLDNKCVIQNIAEPSPEKFNVILRKMMLLIKEDVQDISNDIKEKRFNFDKRKQTKEIFDNFNNFIRRIVIKEKIEGPKNSYLLFYLISQLSLLQHAYFYFYKIYVMNKKIVDDTKIITLLEKINECYLLLYDSFYKKDLNLAHQTRSKSDQIMKEILELISKAKGLDNQYLLLLSNITRIIAVSTTALFGLDFNELENE